MTLFLLFSPLFLNSCSCLLLCLLISYWVLDFVYENDEDQMKLYCPPVIIQPLLCDELQIGLLPWSDQNMTELKLILPLYWSVALLHLRLNLLRLSAVRKGVIHSMGYTLCLPRGGKKKKRLPKTPSLFFRCSLHTLWLPIPCSFRD